MWLKGWFLFYILVHVYRFLKDSRTISGLEFEQTGYFKISLLKNAQGKHTQIERTISKWF